MAKNKTILGGLLVAGVAALLIAPAANALVLNVSTCATWTGSATGNASAGTCSEPAPLSVALKLGNPGCFAFEPSGDSMISSTKVSTGPLSFRATTTGLDSISFDWLFVKINGVQVLKVNPNPLFVCVDAGTSASYSVAAPAGLNTIQFGVHQDAFGDPMGATITAISV